MKKYILFYLMFFTVTSVESMIVKDPTIKPPKKGETITQNPEILPPYNPFSIYVPSKELLSKVPANRVLDLAATAYAANFSQKALYFYTNAIELFVKDPVTIAWATYETGYIYYNRKQYNKALEYFDSIENITGLPSTVKDLSRMMSSRIRNRKEYKVLLKQEDVIFLEDKKQQSILNKQIAKEERAAERLQRQLSKERKQREKEELRLLKEAEKAEKQRLKEQQNSATNSKAS